MRPRSNIKLNPEDLTKITDFTLSHYNEHAEDFWEGTRNHDVSQNITAMLQYIESERPFTILDFGCGPGRDLKAFAELGHLATGLEGAAYLAVMARAYSGCEVWQQDFLKARSTRQLFRWRIRQRLAVSCPQPGVAARLARTTCMSKAGWRVVQLKPARSQSGRLERWTLWRVS
jgi:SAM-dependent methyltransferase